MVDIMIKTTTILTREQEMELLVKAQAGDKASRDMLVEMNLPLVKSIVKKYKENGLPWEDLVNEGVIGLMKAIDEFDVTSGNKLSTFATYKIKQVAMSPCTLGGGQLFSQLFTSFSVRFSHSTILAPRVTTAAPFKVEREI